MNCKYCNNLGKYKDIQATLWEQTAVDECFDIIVPVYYCPVCGKKIYEDRPLTAEQAKLMIEAKNK